MKVLQINSVCGFGSTGRIIMELYSALEEQGHDCLVAYGRKSAPGKVNTIRIGSNLSVSIHALLSRVTDKQGFYSTRSTKRLIEQIKKYDPDIIHLHNLHGYYTNLRELFTYLNDSNKPIFWTLHDCWAFTGHCTYFDFIGCDKWKTGCYDCQQKRAYPASFLLDNSKWNYKQKKSLFTAIKNMTFITPSKWLADLTKQSFLKEYPVTVINNGIDLNIFRPTLGDFREKNHIEDKCILLGVASIWEPRKGLNYFTELFELLDDTYQIVIVGVTEKQKSQLPPGIIGISRTSNANELAEIYTAADIFVNPTLEETFGLVNVEALACGTQVVTFNSGGSPECIDESCGLVVQKGNLNELVTAIRYLAEKRFDADACIKRALQFNIDLINQKYIDTYIEQFKLNQEAKK